MSKTFYSLIFAGLLVGVLLLPLDVKRRVSSVARDALAPFQTVMTDATAFSRTFFQGRRELVAENSRLAIELAHLRSAELKARMLEQENAELRSLLGQAANSKLRLLGAQVIARDLSGWWQIARLDKGSANGVARKMPVITAEGLVGCVVEVTGQTCDVLFLVDPNCKISARLSRMDAFGVLQGQGVSLQGDSLCRMDFIMKEADIAPGDEVVTAGLGGVYPPGLMLGYVSRVYLHKSGLYQTADIIPAADLRAINFVFIVLNDEPARPVAAPAQ